MNLKISSIEYHLPDSKEGVDALIKDNPDWDMPKILDKTGIITRYIAASNETAVDLAVEAGIKILQTAAMDPEEIDLLILVTQSPDYALPTSACMIQDKLGLPKTCMAFDINLGCSGFVYALSVAAGLIESGVVQKGIIICSDTYSKYIDKNDRTCRPIFSDGAAAVCIEKSLEDNIGPFEFGTDGSGSHSLIVKGSGARDACSVAGRPHGTLEMNGSNVFLFTMSVVPKSITALLSRANLSIDDIDLFVFHQASKLVIENLIRILSLDKEKVFTNYESLGNTVSATIPIALKDAVSQHRLQKGDKVLIAGFGVGLSWGAALINWAAVR